MAFSLRSPYEDLVPPLGLSLIGTWGGGVGILYYNSRYWAGGPPRRPFALVVAEFYLHGLIVAAIFGGLFLLIALVTTRVRGKPFTLRHCLIAVLGALHVGAIWAWWIDPAFY